MPIQDDPAVIRMQALINRWQETDDARAIFLSTYRLMTHNMLAAIERQEFHDPDWVDRLLHRFADYYFSALQAYEQDRSAAPAVWQIAHDSCQVGKFFPLQQLLLGVNAHINYDLVLTLADMLAPEWQSLSGEQVELRRADHRKVNEIIARSIDAVQDQVLEPRQPGLSWVDDLLGGLDEHIIARLISRWRETVWENTARLLAASQPAQQAEIILQVEQQALEVCERISLRDWRQMLSSSG